MNPTRLQAESPNLHSAQLATLGGTLTSPEQLWAGARDALFVALTTSGVPAVAAGAIANGGVHLVRELALPHIVAVTVEVGEGITIEGR